MSASSCHGASRLWGLAAILLAAVYGCGDDGGADPDEGGPDGSTIMDGSADPGDGSTDPGDGSTDPGDGSTDPSVCVSLGEPCEATIECCGGRVCESDGSGGKRCIDERFCKGAGTDCARASECCSLSCDGACQDDGSVCKPVDTECDDDAECCSNICDGTCQAIGGACSPMGEPCDDEGMDADCCSKTCGNLGTEEEPDLRCIRASSCGARGEICERDADCCSGVCDDGRCPTQDRVNSLSFAGEPCSKDSDCASYACAANYSGGPKVCQFLGGCRPIGEICTEDWQCCADVHLRDGGPGNMCMDEMEGEGCVAHEDVDGLSICGGQTPQEGPKEVGEICRETDGETKVHDCCPIESCEETRTGVWRCGGPGGFDEEMCVEDGESCRASDECCSGICRPVETEDGETELRCGPCVETGGACTTDADCCELICTDGVCEEPDEGEEVCVPLGAECETDEDCCDGQCFGTCQTLG